MSESTPRIYKEQSGYECPACHTQAKTAVVRSMPMRDCIVRTRKCLVCGAEHETAEVAIGKNVKFYMGLTKGRVAVKELT